MKTKHINKARKWYVLGTVSIRTFHPKTMMFCPSEFTDIGNMGSE
jgi:hypothetical protein